MGPLAGLQVQGLEALRQEELSPDDLGVGAGHCTVIQEDMVGVRRGDLASHLQGQGREEVHEFIEGNHSVH